MSDIKAFIDRKFIRRFGSLKVFVVHTICLLVTIATVIFSLVLTFTADEHTIEKLLEHIALCVLAVVLLNIPVFMRTKLKYNIPAFIHIVVAIFIVAHCILGEVFRLYDHVLLFDKLLHTIAGVVITILGFSIVYGFDKTKSRGVSLSPFFVALFSFCFTIALLVVWEIFEYAMDSLIGVNMQRYKDSLSQIEVDGIVYTVTNNPQGSGLVDTMIDLIVGAVGAVIVCVGGGVLLKKYPQSTKFYITRRSVVTRQVMQLTHAEKGDKEDTLEFSAECISEGVTIESISEIASTVLDETK